MAPPKQVQEYVLPSRIAQRCVPPWLVPNALCVLVADIVFPPMVTICDLKTTSPLIWRSVAPECRPFECSLEIDKDIAQ